MCANRDFIVHTIADLFRHPLGIGVNSEYIVHVISATLLSYLHLLHHQAEIVVIRHVRHALRVSTRADTLLPHGHQLQKYNLIQIGQIEF